MMEKSEIATRLAQLRRTIVRETGGLIEEQLYLLTDVCTWLGLSEQEMVQVVGPGLNTITTLPANLKLHRQAALAKEMAP